MRFRLTTLTRRLSKFRTRRTCQFTITCRAILSFDSVAARWALPFRSVVCRRSFRLSAPCSGSFPELGLRRTKSRLRAVPLGLRACSFGFLLAQRRSLRRIVWAFLTFSFDGNDVTLVRSLPLLKAASVPDAPPSRSARLAAAWARIVHGRTFADGRL